MLAAVNVRFRGYGSSATRMQSRAWAASYACATFASGKRCVMMPSTATAPRVIRLIASSNIGLPPTPEKRVPGCLLCEDVGRWRNGGNNPANHAATDYDGYVGHEFVPAGGILPALKHAFDVCNVGGPPKT